MLRGQGQYKVTSSWPIVTKYIVCVLIENICLKMHITFSIYSLFSIHRVHIICTHTHTPILNVNTKNSQENLETRNRIHLLDKFYLLWVMHSALSYQKARLNEARAVTKWTHTEKKLHKTCPNKNVQVLHNSGLNHGLSEVLLMMQNCYWWYRCLGYLSIHLLSQCWEYTLCFHCFQQLFNIQHY